MSSGAMPPSRSVDHRDDLHEATSTEQAVSDPEDGATTNGLRGRVEGTLVGVDRLQKRWRPAALVGGVVKKYAEDGGGRLAAVVAYYGFFSVFPAILALTAIAGFVLDQRPDLRADLVDSAAGQFPVVGASLADQSLGGSGLALGVGIAGAIWAGLAALVAAQHALNEVWDVPHHDRPNPVETRLRALLMLVVFGLGLVGASVLANLSAQLPIPGLARWGLLIANLLVDIGVAWLAFQILTEKSLSWTSLLPGAVVAGTGYLILQNLGSALIDRYVANAGDVYGTFALVIGLLAWFHLLAQLSLFAAELNVVRSRELHPRTFFGDDLTEGDRRALERHQAAASRREDWDQEGTQ